MTSDTRLQLPPLEDDDVAFVPGGDPPALPVSELYEVLDVPVNVAAVLGHLRMPVADLLRITPGSVLELDRKVGEPIDILVNDRLVARGEVVLIEDRLGVTMTEIVRPGA